MGGMLDDIDGLRAVVTVAQFGGFAAAGRALRLSTNAVSHRVARLEERLGTRLFERTTRVVRTTPAGERLLVRARRVLEELDAVEADVAAGNVEGSVRVALPPDLAGPVLFREVGALLATSPGLRLELFGRSVPVDPRKDGFDLVVWGGPPERIPGDLVARPLGSVAWSLCAAPSYLARHTAPTTPAELSAHACLLARGPSPEHTWTLIDSGGEAVTVPVHGRLESDHPRMLLEALRQGLGVGIRPVSEVDAGVAAGDWVRVLPGWHFRPIPVALVAPKGRLRVPVVKLVAQVLEGVLRQLTGQAPRASGLSRPM
jgi:DNA-binding transcriptional LysR family regulator